MNKIIIIFILLIIIDYIYLSNIGKPLFDKQIKLITGNDMKINLIGVILSYLIVCFGLYYFVLKDKKSITDAFILGLVMYGTFDMTNLALLDKYSIYVGLIDMLWGGFLFATITYIYNNINTQK